MNNNFEKYLGLYYSEPKLGLFLEDLGIKDVPKLKRGDMSAFLVNYDKGIELSFTDEDDLEDSERLREYPEGALVLSNIRLYLTQKKSIKPFEGRLPHGLICRMEQDKVISLLGKPKSSIRNNAQLRWNYELHCVYCDFDDDGNLMTIDLQLPVET